MFRYAVLFAGVGCATATPRSIDNPADAALPGEDAPGRPDAPADTSSGSSCATPFSGMLVTWNLSGQPGSQAVTAPTSSAQGLTVGNLARSAALTAVSGAGSMNASNWATGATRDATKYFSFTLAPAAGCSLDVASLAIDAKASGTGPTMAAAASSQDTYGAVVAVSTTAPSTPALAVTNATTMVELRVYGYAATSTAGTLRIENTLVVTGSLH